MSELTPNELFNIKGAVAVITGGGSGLGRLMALTLASNGASKVYILGRRRDKLDSVASECNAGVVVPIECDITSKVSLERAVQQVEAESGSVNLLIANSGIAGPSMKDLPENPSVADIRNHIMNQEPQDFTQTYATNVTGVFYTIIAFLELLDAGNKKGNMPTNVRSQVIAISSIGAWNKNVGAGFAYNSSKASVNHLVKMLHHYLSPHKIRVNAIAPGFFPSDMAAGILDIKDATKEGAFPTSFIPSQRIGDEQDLAGTLLYMASRAGSYLNGTIILLDGGRSGIINTSY